MSFLQPFLLIFSAAAIIPLIIHLLGERNYKNYPFPTLRFLKELQSSALQKIKLTQWLILLLRILWMLMLILALAKPYFNSQRIIGSKVEKGILLIDATYSMNHNNTFEKERDDIRQAFPHWESLTFNENSFTDSLNIRIKELAHKKNIILFSDLQDNDNTKNLIKFINPDTLTSNKVYIIQKDINKSSVSISSAVLKKDYQTDSKYFTVSVTVDNPEKKYSAHPVYLNINGKRVGLLSLDSKGFGEFSFSAPNEDWILASVDVTGDDSPADNHRYFTIPLIENLHLLYVSSKNNSSYLKPALSDMKDIKLQEAGADNLSLVDLNSFDIIILDGNSDINSGQKKRLIQYAKNKPLWLIMNNEYQTDWTDLYGSLSKENTLSEKSEFSYLNQITPRWSYPYFKTSELIISKYYKSNYSKKETIWTMDNGDPLLYKQYNSEIYIQLSPFNFQWNRMGFSPYFISVIRSTLYGMTNSIKLNININEAITYPGEEFTVTTPGRREYKVKDVFGNTEIPGIYSVLRQDSKEYISVNIPESECILTTCTLDTNVFKIISWNENALDRINELQKGRSGTNFFIVMAALFFILELLLLIYNRKGHTTIL